MKFGSEGVVADDCQLGRAEAPAEPLHCGNARLGRSLALIFMVNSAFGANAIIIA